MTNPKDTKLIPLTQGKFAIVDACDYVEIYKWSWRAARGKSNFYAARSVSNKGKKSIVMMHRFITDCPKGFVVDHINHNTLDNRRDNLRICTNSQNMMNSRPPKRKKRESVYKGISKSSTNRWAAQITVNGRKLYLGNFEKEIDAALEYNKAAMKHFSEFAMINCIPRQAVENAINQIKE